MRSLIKISLVVSIALALSCITAPFGYSQESLCRNFEVANENSKFPPDMIKTPQNGCPGIEDIVGPTPVVDIRPPENSDLAYALSKVWSPEGAPGKSAACDKKCGAAFPVDSIVLATGGK